MKKKSLNVLSILFGLMLINGGLNKFFNYMPVPDDLPLELVNDFEALMEITWLLPLIAAAEILGGLFILQPKTRALGALIIFPVMVGVLLTHVFVDPSQLIMVAVIWAILGWIIYDNREKYQTLIG